ncbi:unnamed protein product [Ceratitis capitata]|uniref:(Mediterranean fruit fly) hypothetical protein n=1 Tax=Ceratitis capitata TaxID=7213 RepID=A0A811UE73_CERCA|nr:unnamed protein product [Ceratitis capitata]
MSLSDVNLLSKYYLKPKIPSPLNLSPPGVYNWDYGEVNEVPTSFNYNDYDDLDGFEQFHTQQPRRRRPILPRSSLC